MEIDLGLRSRPIRLGHKPRVQRSARLGSDLRATPTDVIAHRRVRQARRIMLVDQPRQNPSRGVALLLRGIQIRTQHLVNRRLERRQPRRHPVRSLTRRRHRRFQRLAHRPPMDPMLLGQRPDRQTLDPMIPPDRRELLHP